jgi:ribosomal protein S18 acetylase RimI-like enzyme
MTFASLSLVSIRRAGADEASLLSSLAASTFSDTFARDNTAADMAAYCAQTFGESLQREELLDPRTTVLLAARGGTFVGYAMLREHTPPECVAEADVVEIARLYAVQGAIGTGVGAALMRTCLHEAMLRDRTAVWLGVWERNARAIAFYERWGFRDVGAQQFQLGTDRQTDRVMVRPVTGED